MTECAKSSKRHMQFCNVNFSSRFVTSTSYLHKTENLREIKVHLGKDQEKAQSEKIPTPKTEVVKN